MFLAIDVGNSNIVFAIFNEENQTWTNHFRVDTEPDSLQGQLTKKVPLYFLEHGLSPQDIEKIGISSVVPHINPILQAYCQSFFGTDPYLITSQSYAKLPVKTIRPNEIGTDLMCNVLGAWDRFRQATIVVDFGTALTFTVIDDSGQVLGVSIVPGLKTAIRSLSSNTAKLPQVDLKLPESAIGKNTVHAIQAGILFGYSGLVKEMIQIITEETKLSFKVIATGGLSEILTNLEGVFDESDKNLTLQGLRLMTLAND